MGKKSPATAGHNALWLGAQADEEEEIQPGPVTKQRRVALQYNHSAARSPNFTRFRPFVAQ